MAASQKVESNPLLKIAGQHELSKEDNDDVCNPLINFHQCSQLHPAVNTKAKICKGKDCWKKNLNNLDKNPLNHISMISWNILSETWYDEWDTTPQGIHFDWKHDRFPQMLEWLTSLNASIVCFQEVDFTIFEDELLPYMQTIGYDGRIQQWKNNQSQPCAVATFWKSSEYSLVDSATFSRTLVLRLKSHQSQIDENNNSTLINQNASEPDLDQCLIEFCVINAHLESLQTVDGADKRARQINSPLSWVSKSKLPMFLAGDFNTGADSMLMHVLRKHQWHNQSLAVAYEHPDAEFTLPAHRATFARPQMHFRIDHLLYSHEFFELNTLLDPLSSSECDQFLGNDKSKGFPNYYIPSDHMPIGACFRINKENFRQKLLKQQFEDNEALLINKLEKSVSLSPERNIELEEQWLHWKSLAPPKLNRAPSEEEIKIRKDYKVNMKNWLVSLTSQEQIFVNGLKRK